MLKIFLDVQGDPLLLTRIFYQTFIVSVMKIDHGS